MQLEGIHHISAVTGDASRNVDFYTRVLGMRLTKKTVNQDDISVYHLFYGDTLGSPGTDLTFFEFPDPTPHRPGAGTISTIALGVNGEDALQWWEQRFTSMGIEHDALERLGEQGPLAIHFRDPEGQRLALVDAEGSMQSVVWEKSPIPAPFAIQGFYAVNLTYRKLEPTATFLTKILGFRKGRTYQTSQQAEVVVFETGKGGPGTEVHIEIQPQAPWRRFVGVGGVHHVAFRVPTDEEHHAWRDQIEAVYPHITPVIDRYYFRSLYFREPAGVLFELATDLPGFTIDEDVEALGERLSLPPFLEARRTEIEAQLHPILPLSSTL